MFHPEERTQGGSSLPAKDLFLSEENREHLWSIILAGGNGERVKPLVIRWLKCQKPKQYCAFVGTRSMLEHTLARADLLSDPDRQVTVILRAHLADAQSQVAGRRIAAQPENLDTGVGIFFGLTHVLARDAAATVVIYPSDHFVYPENRFIEVVANAVEATRRMPDHITLLGVPPDRPETEYGWLFPGPVIGWSGGRTVKELRAFLEKPSRSEAEAAMSSGALWNTLVLAARARTLWQTGWRYFPEVMRLLAQLEEAVGTDREEAVTDTVYRTMPQVNFCSELLALAADKTAVIELDGVLWCDWGSPSRISETLQRIGKVPAFPMECLEPVKAEGARGSGPVFRAGK